jgi:hypothetical protein
MRKEKKKEKKTKKKRSYICITQMHISTGWGGGDHPVLISLLVPDTNALHPSVAKGQYQMLPSTKEGFPTGGKRSRGGCYPVLKRGSQLVARGAGSIL